MCGTGRIRKQTEVSTTSRLHVCGDVQSASLSRYQTDAARFGRCTSNSRGGRSGMVETMLRELRLQG